jgi:hypothetical protein
MCIDNAHRQCVTMLPVQAYQIIILDTKAMHGCDTFLVIYCSKWTRIGFLSLETFKRDISKYDTIILYMAIKYLI